MCEYVEKLSPNSNFPIHCYPKVVLSVNPIPTGQGRNRSLYERHVTKSGRNRVKVIPFSFLKIIIFFLLQKNQTPNINTQNGHQMI